ncbi:hypothetical protein RM543_03675 [Roseicyclus sp. F158]|uniref:Uncharacterized protein n=1 Tax=Tropicimonas omnivorans TaxID=3075590 RepID=A0ABU3DDH6_9RHOB|nr:hypothetical protein [Roseicyclus sp. F158]MDT0681773.1 hypothetical protein [Roseicyclus sp. F158]
MANTTLAIIPVIMPEARIIFAIIEVPSVSISVGYATAIPA